METQITIQTRFKNEGMISKNLSINQKLTYEELRKNLGARNLFLDGQEIPPNRIITKTSTITAFYQEPIKKEEFFKRCEILNTKK